MSETPPPVPGLPSDTWVTAVDTPRERDDLPVWGTPATGEDDGWERLSAKKLVLDPLSALKSMAIPIIAVAVGSSTAGTDLWISLALGGGLLLMSFFAVIPWFTERYRVTDQRLQFRKGLLSKTVMSAPLDRIRSVDLEANLLHRILGLRNVQIGTGVDNDRIELDGMNVARAEALRQYLLDRRAQNARLAAAATVDAAVGDDEAIDAEAAATDDTRGAASPEQVLAVLNWRWLRFAPFDLTRLAVIVAAVGFLGQILGENLVPDSFLENVDDRTRSYVEASVTMFVITLVIGAVASWLLVAVLGYVIQWWGLKLARSDGSLHLTHGLLTTRSISVEEKRVRGVEIREPLLLRPVKGAELSTLATGVGTGGKTGILPQAPTPLVRRIGEDVAGAAGVLTMPLVRHPAAARRRAHVREQWGTITLLVLGWAVHGLFVRFSEFQPELWWFLVPGAIYLVLAPIFAELAYAHLGHALTDDHLIVGSGTTARVRTVLEVDGIIGWVVERSPFQRRLGLCTLTATTAAGGEKVEILDVEEDVAIALIQRATPDSVAPFLRTGNDV